MLGLSLADLDAPAKKTATAKTLPRLLYDPAAVLTSRTVDLLGTAGRSRYGARLKRAKRDHAANTYS